MFLLAIWIALIGLGIYRSLVLALPFFHEAISQAPALNISCGALSDLSFGLVLAFVGLLSVRLVSERWRRFFGRFAVIVACVYVYSLAVHIRYVEHFGMNARPYHAVAMENGEMWLVGTMMVLTSARSWLIIGPMIGSLALFWTFAKRAELRWVRKSARRAALVLGGALLGAWASHAAVIQLRNKPAMHNELRYNVYLSLYYNYEEFKHIKSLPIPTPEQLARLRDLLPGPREFADGKLGRDIPLWQKRLPTAPASDPSAERVRESLKDFIAEKTAAEGPWNVVIVLSESLRANEIQSMGEAPPEFQELTPHLSAMAADGVQFTEVMSSGLRTHFGQTASQCSLNGALDFTILQGAPMSNAVCLGDVFSKKGYDTYFFYGADNHFDNQDVFYQKHGIHHVEDENDMAKGGQKGGWGYSDAYLFQHARTQLEGAKKPFFAVVLTLTNHPPLKIPGDVPPGLIRDALPDRGKMLQYVDWSAGEFYQSLKRNFPRTLFLFIADHGQFWGDEGFYNQIPTFDQMRKIARIPFFIVPIHPDAPVAVRGKSIVALASNVDVAPTLLTLLGWGDTPQQFMGIDAFARTGPVYIDWFNKLLRLEAVAGAAATVNQVDAEREELIGTAGRYNLLAPALSDR